MHPGFIVGTLVAVMIIIIGIAGKILGKKNDKENKWAGWLIFAGIVALISAVINYNLSGF